MRRTTWDIDDQRAREKLCSLIDEYLIGPKSEKAREVLKLYMVDGKTYEQIEEETQLSVSTIGRYVRRCYDKLVLML
jgi:RNA polymerase sigma factor (sigma-70 family)